MRDRTLTAIVVGGLLVCAALALLIGRADAAPPCGERRAMERWLGQRYGELPIAVGTAGPSGIVQLYLSAAGTYSLVATDTRGLSCIVASGDGWEFVRPSKTNQKPVDERGG